MSFFWSVLVSLIVVAMYIAVDPRYEHYIETELHDAIETMSPD